VKTLLTLIWYYWQFRAHGGGKYVNMSGILVHNLSDCLYKLRQTSFVELERGKPIMYNRTKVLQNSVPTRLHLRANDVNYWESSIYVYGNTAPQTVSQIYHIEQSREK